MKPVIVTKELISIGLPVMRGRDWCYSDQDSGAGNKGKVVAIGDDNGRGTLEGWCSVEWENGAKYIYRIGYESSYDLYVYAPGYYGTITPGKVKLNYQNAKAGLKVELNSNATHFAKDKLKDILNLVIEKVSYLAVSFVGVRGEFKFESFDICTDQTVKEDYKGVSISGTSGQITVDPSDYKWSIDVPKPTEEPIYNFKVGDVVYMRPEKHDAWTRYSGVKDDVRYLVDEVNGKTFKLNALSHWQVQDSFMDHHRWVQDKMLNSRFTTSTGIGSLQKNVVAIAENSKQTNIKQNGTNTDNPDYSGRPLELPSIIISLERGERIEGTRLHS